MLKKQKQKYILHVNYKNARNGEVSKPRPKNHCLFLDEVSISILCQCIYACIYNRVLPAETGFINSAARTRALYTSSKKNRARDDKVLKSRPPKNHFRAIFCWTRFRHVAHARRARTELWAVGNAGGVIRSGGLALYSLDSLATDGGFSLLLPVH